LAAFVRGVQHVRKILERPKEASYPGFERSFDDPESLVDPFY
jgi:hypothetical protein